MPFLRKRHSAFWPATASALQGLDAFVKAARSTVAVFLIGAAALAALPTSVGAYSESGGGWRVETFTTPEGSSQTVTITRTGDVTEPI